MYVGRSTRIKRFKNEFLEVSMSKYSKLGRVAKCGSPDSKYMSRPNALEDDINAKIREHEAFKSLVRHLVIREPAKMELRYRDLIDVAMEIKQEFKL